MNDLDYSLYVVAELNYESEHPNILKDDLYPVDWYSITNYKIKNKIIAEAIKKKILVMETDLYKEYKKDVEKVS